MQKRKQHYAVSVFPQADCPTPVASGRQHCTNSPENSGLRCCICTKKKAIALCQVGAVNPPQPHRAHAARGQCGTPQAPGSREPLTIASCSYAVFILSACSWNAKIAEHSREKLKAHAMDKLNFPGQTGECWDWIPQSQSSSGTKTSAVALELCRMD